MDISKTIAELKKLPGFTEKVGMLLIHNGVVRATSRSGPKAVARLEVYPDQAKIDAICAELSARPGVFKVLAKANSGTFAPGDDLLFIIAAGDIRETVLPILAEALNRIKSEAVKKSEHFSVD